MISARILKITNAKARNSTVAQITGRSRFVKLFTIRYPNPGREKIFSTMAEPAIHIPIICINVGTVEMIAWGMA